MMTLTESIREEARRLGFFKTGVAAAGVFPWSRRLDAWLADGMHGAMTYLERQAEKRRNLGLVLPGARSLLILAMNYYARSDTGIGTLQGRISRYARGEDYHRLMDERMRALLAFVKRAAPAAQGVCYADTGPVMEKAWGACSALGWMGKHSNLITREMGSWFFLGVMLLDVDLDCDPAAADRCGTCTRCLTACPTGAIVAPHVVDARLCISYLTIELKGAIPHCLRPLIGNRIFGCDDCQEVCPWNRFAAETSEPRWPPSSGSLAPALAPLACMTAQEFNARFRNSPIRRAGRNGLVRNVVIALGNSREPEAVPPLLGALCDASALVRGHAAWALGRIGDGGVETALRKALEKEVDPCVRGEIEMALQVSTPAVSPRSKRHPFP
jgi:epoxyqueuosine reductase